MPRKARKEINSKFLHVMIQGINREYIFNNDKDIKVFLKFVKEKIKEFDLSIIAYCVMNNHAHFLIYTENINLVSKLMKMVNTSYAIYYNKNKERCGYVFRDRFKSEEILSQKHLVSCIQYIHNNPVKAKMCLSQSEYKYSSYNEYKNKPYLINKNKVIEILRKYNINIEMFFDKSTEKYKFIDDMDPQNKKIIKISVLEEFCKEKNIGNMNELRSDKSNLKEIAIIMNKDYNFTQKEIAEVIGISRLKIHRIIHS